MVTLVVKHHPSNGPADPLALVDGPTYDADPHIVTGAENIDNTSDVNKPVSTAQAAADAVVAATAANASNLTSGTVAVGRLPAVNSMTALRALPVPTNAVAVMLNSYYGDTDYGSGGVFVWNIASSATDNAGTIIQADAGGTGRWIRQTFGVYTPEMFGARHDGVAGTGTDDQIIINLTIVAAAAVGASVRFSKNNTYIVGSYSGNGISCIKLASGVNIILEGTVTLKTNTNVADSIFVATGSGTNLTVASITSGTIHLNSTLAGTGISGLVTIVSQTSGTTGGTGVYVTSAATTSVGATITAVRQFAHIFGSYDPDTLSHFTMSGDGIINYNGANNSVGGTAYASCAHITIQNGLDIEIRSIKCLNQAGSNNILIGRNIFPPSISDVSILDTVHENSGDNVNAAANDHSSIWVNADGYKIDGNILSSGPKVNGAALEYYGRNGGADNNTISSYFNIVNIANQTSGGTTSTGLSFTNNRAYQVNCGVTIWGRTGANQNNVLVSGNNIQLDPASPRYYVDADSQVSTGGNNNSLVISNNLFQSPIGSTALTSSGMILGAWNNLTVDGNTVTNCPGPAIETTANFPGAAILQITNNELTNPGLSTTAAFKIGIKCAAAAGNLASALIANNAISGTTLTSGINSSLSVASANGSGIYHNAIAGATTRIINGGNLDVLNKYATGVTTFLETPTSANLIAAVTDETGTGALVFANTPTLVTPNIGAATGTSLVASQQIKSTSPTAGVGYAAGAGGAVTQITSRATGVTLNTLSGAITLFAAAPVVGTWGSFTVTNSAVAATDTITVSVKSSTNTYNVAPPTAVGTGSFQISFASVIGTASDSPVINFNVIKGVIS